MSWRRGQTATYWPKVLLTIAALLPHLGWGCSTVGHYKLILTLASCPPTDSNSNSNWPKPSASAVPLLIYTGASLDWRLGRGSIYNIMSFKNENAYLSHFILERVDVGCVWEMSWRRGQTAILTQSSSDHSSTSFSSWLGCSTVGHWRPKVLCLQLGLTSLASCLQLTRTAPDTWLYYFLTSACFRSSSAYLHRCVSWLTAQSRVNI